MISVSGAKRHADQHTRTHTTQHTTILRFFFFFFFWPDRVVVMAAGGRLEDPVFLMYVLHHRSIRIFVIPSMPAITKEQRTNGGGDARLYFPQPKLFGTIKIKIKIKTKSKMAMDSSGCVFFFFFFSRRRRHMSMTIKGRRSIFLFFSRTFRGANSLIESLI
jgi:hypothetical protein